MTEYTLLKRAGLKIPNSWQTGVDYVPAQEVEGVLAKKQAELMAIQSQLAQLVSLVKRTVSGLEGVVSGHD